MTFSEKKKKKKKNTQIFKLNIFLVNTEMWIKNEFDHFSGLQKQNLTSKVIMGPVINLKGLFLFFQNSFLK